MICINVTSFFVVVQITVPLMNNAAEVNAYERLHCFNICHHVCNAD